MKNVKEVDLSEEIDRMIREKRYRLVNSVIIWQEGEILAERYYNGFDRDSRNVLRSVMKSILSAATGIALQKGLLAGFSISGGISGKKGPSSSHDHPPASADNDFGNLLDRGSPLPLSYDGTAAEVTQMGVLYSGMSRGGYSRNKVQLQGV